MSNKEIFQLQKAKHRLRIIKHAEEITNNVAKTCRYYGIPRGKYYFWKKRYEEGGIDNLKDKTRTPKNMPHATRQEVVDRIIYLRKNYHFGHLKLRMYLERYHGIKIGKTSIARILIKHGLRRLPRTAKHARHTKRWKRYEKPSPGYQLQVDVKFMGEIKLKSERKQRKYYQYTAIDDCSRIRVLKAYPTHDQKTSVAFTDYALSRFPFKIDCVQTDNGGEFTGEFHWHLLDNGIRHVYIKPRTPRLNGKVERSHRIDNEEFYQLLQGRVIDSLDQLNFKMKEWQDYYNFHRPHGGLGGKTPYEKLQSKLSVTKSHQNV